MHTHTVTDHGEFAELVNKRVADVPPLVVPPGPFELRDADGRQWAVVVPIDAATVDSATRVLRNHDFAGVMRAGGMRTRSSVFGYSAAQPQFQRNTPSAAAWAYEDPEGHRAIADLAGPFWDLFTRHVDADAAAPTLAAREATDPAWRMADTAWTSGIVNDTSPLYYHYDRNNTRGAWSAMLVRRAATRGGHLNIPRFGVALPCRDLDVVFFPGVDLVHGVTPIQRTHNAGFRYTAVYYPVRAFTRYGPPAEALAASQARQTELAEGLLERQRRSGLLE